MNLEDPYAGLSTTLTKAQRARIRAAATKALRSNIALVEAAYELSSEYDWSDIRMEDIAKRAHVSVATAYNHFGTKHLLVRHVFRKLMGPIDDAVSVAINQGDEPIAAIAAYLISLARLVHSHRSLTLGLLTARAARPDADSDLYKPVVLDKSLLALLDYAHDCGYIDEELSRADIANYHFYALLVQVIVPDGNGAVGSAEVAMSQLMPVLKYGCAR